MKRKSTTFSSVAQSCLTLQSHEPQHTRPFLSIINSQSLPKLMSIKLVMPSNHLILCRPLLLLPSIFPSITVFSNESAPHIISHEEIENYSSNEVDETGAYYTEWSKPERKTPIQYTNAYIWNLERC